MASSRQIIVQEAKTRTDNSQEPSNTAAGPSGSSTTGAAEQPAAKPKVLLIMEPVNANAEPQPVWRHTAVGPDDASVLPEYEEETIFARFAKTCLGLGLVVGLVGMTYLILKK